ncbi:MAG: MmcQ/YjbR family DNA-binding protein [Thermoanaerobaculia bacterium]
MQSEDIDARIRSLCLKLPHSSESFPPRGHAFSVGGKTFAVIEDYNGHHSLAVKGAIPGAELFPDEDRFFVTPLVGRRGWISLILDRGELDWREIAALLELSYRQVASRRALKALEAWVESRPPLHGEAQPI